MIRGLPEITVEPVQQQPKAPSPTPSMQSGRLGVTQVTTYEDPQSAEMQKELDGWRAKRKLGVSCAIAGCLASAGCIGLPIWTSTLNIGAVGEAITYGLIGGGLFTGMGLVSFVSLKAGHCARKETETLEKMDDLPVPLKIETRL